MVHLKTSHSLHRDAEVSFSSRLRFVAVWFLFLQTQALHAAATEGDRLRAVSRQELLEVMNQQKDYDPTATTNGARFQAEVLLGLARQARARDPEGAPLSVNHEDWFQGFLEVIGRTLESDMTREKWTVD